LFDVGNAVLAGPSHTSLLNFYLVADFVSSTEIILPTHYIFHSWFSILCSTLAGISSCTVSRRNTKHQQYTALRKPDLAFRLPKLHVYSFNTLLVSDSAL